MPLSLKLSQKAAEDVRWLAEQYGITYTEALARGLSLHRFVAEVVESGGVFMVQGPDGAMSRVHFVWEWQGASAEVG